MIPQPLLAAPLDSLDDGQIFVLSIIAISCGTALLISLGGLIASAVGSAHRRKVEADLKREMLDRGMSAEEIATVIGASLPPEDAVGRWINAYRQK